MTRLDELMYQGGKEAGYVDCGKGVIYERQVREPAAWADGYWDGFVESRAQHEQIEQEAREANEPSLVTIYCKACGLMTVPAYARHTCLECEDWI